ncbi:FAD-dependent oxidoreductase [Streptomyces sp. NPDC046821]|uniref:FAD-dependent oxidoreductase n=1 Tax=Streptomyces sp. NPDC046821 TaxID=3154702 RepID=UPI0033FCAFF0
MTPRHIVIVGAGPAGLALAETALSAGTRVTLPETPEVAPHGGELPVTPGTEER